MAFPSSTVNPPTLSGLQMWFSDLTMGTGAGGVNFTEIDGLDLGNWRTGDQPRPRDHGEFIGYDVLGGRDITVKFDVKGTSPADLGANMIAVATAMAPAGATESPLYLFSPVFGTLACMARPRNRSWNYDNVLDKGNRAQGLQMQWHATDPRLYAAPTVVTTIPFGSATGTGFTFPFSFPLSFGGAGDAASAVIVNAGNIDCRPIITVNGPVNQPTIANGSIAGVPSLNFDINLRAGNYLAIDTDLKTVLLYNGSGTAVAQSSILLPGSQWWSLQPGANLIQLNMAATTGSPTVQVEWASAYLL